MRLPAAELLARVAAAVPGLGAQAAGADAAAAAVDTALAYERLLGTAARGATAAFWAVHLDEPAALTAAAAAAAPAAFAGKAALTSLHCTLAYHGGVVDPALAVALLGDGAQRRQLRIDGLVWDDRAVAAVVADGAHDCVNRHAHVTLAVAPRTSPAHSNAVLEAAERGAAQRAPFVASAAGAVW
jgi:hypothetical protein